MKQASLSQVNPFHSLQSFPLHDVALPLDSLLLSVIYSNQGRKRLPYSL